VSRHTHTGKLCIPTDNGAVRQTVPVHNMALTWQQAAWLTAVLAVAALLARAVAPRAAAVVRECALICGLYSVWQLAGELSVSGTGDPFARARWIERVEGDLWLPSERSMQKLITGHAWLVHAADYYYATMHFGGLFVFLIWLWFRHREHYRPVRRVLALTTLVCLLIQLVPVAPPRLLPGFVDTAARNGESVYSLGFDADQLSAMPSVHVAWAVLIGVAAARVGRGAFRWLGAVHTVLTAFVVVATANHFWLDGVVAAVVLALCAAAEAGGQRVLRRRRVDPGLRVEPKASILA
jgi:PAP2 superfamily protein